MKQKKVIMVLLVWVMLLGFAEGCGDTSQARLEQQRTVVTQAQAVSQDLGQQLADLQTAVDNLQEAMNDPCLTPEVSAEAKELLTKAAAEIETITAKKSLADEQLAVYQAELDKILAQANGNADIGDEIQSVGAGIGATAPFIPQPWGAVVGLIGAIVGVVGTVYSKIQKAKANEATAEAENTSAITSNIVQSVEALLKKLPKSASDPPLLLEPAKDELSKVQDTVTKEVVKEIKKELNTNGGSVA